ncbi:MAG: VWA-like domain-containing protein [Bacteroidales bacterium]|nr:VWA-like domain-containing protein [Bacteroidales bacterium]
MELPYFDMLSEEWFLQEPAFFALFCTQRMQENVKMECALRCGQGVIEYNPLILEKKNYRQVEQLMRIEMIRLFLKHPYERQPDGCSREAMALGSDCTIEDGYCFLNEKLPLKGPGFYHLPMGETYEYYAKKIQEQNQKDDDRDGKGNNNENRSATGNDCNSDNGNDANNADGNDRGNEAKESKENRNEDRDKAELWREDALRRSRINDLIERTSDWGTIPGDIVERIKASTKARINNSYIMQGFRSSVISSRRQLTRMKPNRRTGFLQMGNSRQFDTSLLVAVDVSGSVTEPQIADFYSVVNRVFRFGIAKIDCVQFDSCLGEIKPLQHASNEIKVVGRGGTSFQPIFDFLDGNSTIYDGVMILTDGQAPPPIVPDHFKINVLWVCSDRQAYEADKEWMTASGRVCFI